MVESQQDNQGKRDLSSRLVAILKDVAGDEAPAVVTTGLRVLFLTIAAATLALWFASLIPAYESWGDPREDGFSFIPASYTTITLLPVGIFLLIGAIVGRGKPLARARKALYISIALLFIVMAFLILQFIANTPEN